MYFEFFQDVQSPNKMKNMKKFWVRLKNAIMSHCELIYKLSNTKQSLTFEYICIAKYASFELHKVILSNANHISDTHQ